MITMDLVRIDVIYKFREITLRVSTNVKIKYDYK